eukprot:Rhum_TRINITY_DN11643_c0_g1::Rhum_TRINITY_DN11643_c0_g1_i1::g.45955::m.45955/K04739/PRKAR; cAMP-dependent protein kinase regulator
MGGGPSSAAGAPQRGAHKSLSGFVGMKDMQEPDLQVKTLPAITTDGPSTNSGTAPKEKDKDKDKGGSSARKLSSRDEDGKQQARRYSALESKNSAPAQSPLIPAELRGGSRGKLSVKSEGQATGDSKDAAPRKSMPGDRLTGSSPGKSMTSLLQLLRDAQQQAEDRQGAGSRFRREERHIVMQLYDALGLYENEMMDRPQNALQEVLVEYRFPPQNMAALKDVQLDMKTATSILGEKEVERRVNAGVIELSDELLRSDRGAAPIPGIEMLAENLGDESEEKLGDNLRKEMRRRGVSSETMNATGTDSGAPARVPVQEKSVDQIARLTQVVRQNILFAPLDSRDRVKVFAALQEAHFACGHEIIKQGDDGDSYYIIESGTCSISKCDEDDETESQRNLGQLQSGDSFGELALMYGTQRAATITATSPVVCWQLDRDTYRGMLHNITQRKRERYMSFLNKIAMLRNLGEYDKARIADMLEPQELQSGDVVCREGTTGDTFFMIEQGTVSVETVERREICRLGEGDYFGELALLYSQPRKATVIAVEKTHLVCLRRKAFESYLGNLEELKHAASKYQGKNHLKPLADRDTGSQVTTDTEMDELGSLLDNFDADAEARLAETADAPESADNTTSEHS